MPQIAKPLTWKTQCILPPNIIFYELGLLWTYQDDIGSHVENNTRSTKRNKTHKCKGTSTAWAFKAPNHTRNTGSVCSAKDRWRLNFTSVCQWPGKASSRGHHIRKVFQHRKKSIANGWRSRDHPSTCSTSPKFIVIITVFNFSAMFSILPPFCLLIPFSNGN
jgi:hypothetical protein